MRKRISVLSSAVLGLGVFSFFILSGCSSSNDSSSNLPPPIRPPVQQALPSKLLNGSKFSSKAMVRSFDRIEKNIDYTQTCQTDTSQDACSSLSGVTKLQCIIKQRLFCDGPTAVLNLLDNVDNRMQDIQQQANSTTACLGNTPSDHTNDLTFPGNQTFTHFLQCLDSNIPLGFGQKDGVWYIREANGAEASVFSVDKAGVSVNGYTWLPSKDATYSQSTMILQIRADKSLGIVEFTGGGVGVGFCAVHFLSDANHIWIFMNPEGAGQSCDYDADGATDSADYSEICLNSNDLSVATSNNCLSLKSGAKLSMIGRAASTNVNNVTWAAAASPASGQIYTENLNSLETLFQNAAQMTGVTVVSSGGSNTKTTSP